MQNIATTYYLPDVTRVYTFHFIIFFTDPSPLQLICQFLQEAENQINSNGPSADPSQGTHTSPLTPPLSPIGSPQTSSPQPMDVDSKATGDQADVKREKLGK